MTGLINRLKEPSTYAGLSGLALLVFGVSPDQFQVYAGAAAGVFAFASIILAEVGARE